MLGKWKVCRPGPQLGRWVWTLVRGGLSALVLHEIGFLQIQHYL
jgi:hypothetical protein